MDVTRLYSLAIFLLISYFTVEAFDDITSRVFDSNIDGVIAAFGDFNSDKLTDMFFITEKGKSIEVFLASEKEPLFQKATPIRCQYNGLKITSVMPGDFNGDSQMDVLITLQENPPDPKNHTIAAVLWGHLKSLDCNINENVTMNVQPVLLDYNADMIPDLYGESVENKRTVWFIKANATQNVTLADDQLRIRPVHSNSFVNLNSDMAADIFVTTIENHYEIWFNEEGNFPNKTLGTFNMSGEGIIIGQSTFLDIDLDGHLDHVVPVCFHSCLNSTIYVNHKGAWFSLTVPFTTEDGTWRFFFSDAYPINLRVGDFNLDGYPDILTIVTLNETTREAVLFENKPCPGCMYHRRLTMVRHFKEFKSVVLASFYDIFQDGTLDFILVSEISQNSFKVTALQNEINNDVCFIKVLVLSGLCYRNCPGLSSKPYGVNQPGPFIKYKTTRSDGSAQTSCAAQLTQSAHFSLQLPYTVFGLGQTANFVDDLHVGIPRSTLPNEDNSHSWTSIIPNSQMIVIPLKNSDGSITWINNLFVTPSHQVLLTLIALSGTCVIVIIIIGGLHWKEKIEDKKEKLQEAHRFHFDAM